MVTRILFFFLSLQAIITLCNRSRHEEIYLLSKKDMYFTIYQPEKCQIKLAYKEEM